MLRLLTAILVLAARPPQDSEAAKKARTELETLRTSIDKLVKIHQTIQSIDQQLRKGSDDPDRLKALAQQRQDAVKEFQELRPGAIQSMDALLASATEGLRKSPEDAGLLEVRSEAYQLYSRDDEALGDLEALLRLRPADPEVGLRAGRIQQKLNRYEEAAANLEKYLKKDPNHLESRSLLAMTYFALHRFGESTSLFDEILKDKLDPSQERSAKNYRTMADSYVELWKKEREIRALEEKANDLPRVTFSTSKGEIEAELFEDQAPNTVANFVELISKKFYDGLKFHRVEPGFMAQGGCPLGDGSGDAGYRFKDEIPAAYRRHFRGSLSMANSGPDTNGSQFFITHLPTEWLNGKHTVFGRVLKGQEVVDRLRAGDEIKKVEVTRKRDHPYQVQKIAPEK